MAKTPYSTFKDLPTFYQQLKPCFASDFRVKDLITNIYFTSQVYHNYQHDQHYNGSDTAINKLIYYYKNLYEHNQN